MFYDYYLILECSEFSTPAEIKYAFRLAAVKWHPDRNKGIDTTEKMQLINEAYLILKDDEARERYNVEYQKFKKETEEEIKIFKTKHKEYTHSKENKAKDASSFDYFEYDNKDEVLQSWIQNAKKQAVHLAQQTIKDFAVLGGVAIKEGVKGASQMIIFQIVVGFLFLILFGIFKGCA